MRALLVAGSVALSTLAGHAVAPSDAGASACNCIRAGFGLVSPAAHQPAPTTTTVRVSFADVWHVPVRIILRADDGTLVPATQQAVRGGSQRVVELTPRAKLAAGTRYEVIAIEFGPRHVATVVGAFHTAATTDVGSISVWPWRTGIWPSAPLAFASAAHERPSR